MDNWILQFEKLTVELLVNLETSEYEDLQRFVEARGALIAELLDMQVPLSVRNQYAERIQHIEHQGSAIIHRMEALKREATFMIQKMGQAKSQRKAYDPYQDGSNSSLLYDTIR